MSDQLEPASQGAQDVDLNEMINATQSLANDLTSHTSKKKKNRRKKKKKKKALKNADEDPDMNRPDQTDNSSKKDQLDSILVGIEDYLQTDSPESENIEVNVIDKTHIPPTTNVDSAVDTMVETTQVSSETNASLTDSLNPSIQQKSKNGADVEIPVRDDKKTPSEETVETDLDKKNVDPKSTTLSSENVPSRDTSSATDLDKGVHQDVNVTNSDATSDVVDKTEYSLTSINKNEDNSTRTEPTTIDSSPSSNNVNIEKTNDILEEEDQQILHDDEKMASSGIKEEKNEMMTKHNDDTTPPSEGNSTHEKLTVPETTPDEIDEVTQSLTNLHIDIAKVESSGIDPKTLHTISIGTVGESCDPEDVPISLTHDTVNDDNTEEQSVEDVANSKFEKMEGDDKNHALVAENIEETKSRDIVTPALGTLPTDNIVDVTIDEAKGSKTTEDVTSADPEPKDTTTPLSQTSEVTSENESDSIHAGRTTADEVDIPDTNAEAETSANVVDDAVLKETVVSEKPDVPLETATGVDEDEDIKNAAEPESVEAESVEAESVEPESTAVQTIPETVPLDSNEPELNESTKSTGSIAIAVEDGPVSDSEESTVPLSTETEQEEESSAAIDAKPEDEEESSAAITAKTEDNEEDTTALVAKTEDNEEDTAAITTKTEDDEESTTALVTETSAAELSTTSEEVDSNETEQTGQESTAVTTDATEGIAADTAEETSAATAEQTAVDTTEEIATETTEETAVETAGKTTEENAEETAETIEETAEESTEDATATPGLSLVEEDATTAALDLGGSAPEGEIVAAANDASAASAADAPEEKPAGGKRTLEEIMAETDAFLNELNLDDAALEAALGGSGDSATASGAPGTRSAERERKQRKETPTPPEELPPVYIYTSLAGGGFHMVPRTNRLATILQANRIPFTYRDLGTDAAARTVWRTHSAGRQLPGVVRGERDIIGNWEEIDDINEDYRLRAAVYDEL